MLKLGFKEDIENIVKTLGEPEDYVPGIGARDEAVSLTRAGSVQRRAARAGGSLLGEG